MATYHFDPYLGFIERSTTGEYKPVVKNNVSASIDFDKDANDLILRESGLQQDIYLAGRIQSALTDPGAYLAARATAISKIGTDLTRVFRDEYFRYLEVGMPPEEAKMKASKHAIEQKKKFLKLVEYQFPTEVNKRAEQALMNK